MTRLVRNMRGYQSLLEQVLQAGSDVRGGVSRDEQRWRRRATLQARRDIGDVAVGIPVLVAGKCVVWILDRLVGNIKDANDDAAIFDCGALLGGIDDRGVIASRPAPALIERLGLWVLRAVGYEENKRLRAGG